MTSDAITTHSLAKQWLNNPDGYLTATLRNENGEEEYTIHSYQQARTCANKDDTSFYWTLNLGKCITNNFY